MSEPSEKEREDGVIDMSVRRRGLVLVLRWTRRLAPAQRFVICM
jgi:hypothetical protein